MESRKHIVVFSHGFGVDKTSHGLFTDIADALAPHGVESVMFDYNDFDPGTKETSVKPFSEQAEVLGSVIGRTARENPGATIDIVAQSQGAVMVALCDVSGVRRVVCMSPFFHTDIHKVMERYKRFPESEIDVKGVSRRVRSDGTVTVIPPEYWSERFATDVYDLYNRLALATDLTIIRAGEDTIMEGPDLLKIFNAKIINVHGDHDFSAEYRPPLLKVVENAIVG